MPAIPRDPALDRTLAFRADPYLFISRRCRELGTEVFETRLQLRKTLCMTGSAAARVFYDPKRFARAGATPEPIRATLLGKGGVQGLDGNAHRHRKRLFMSFMTPERVKALAVRAQEEMRLHARNWNGVNRIVLYDMMQDVLARAACQWAGVPIEEPGFGGKVRDLSALFDSAANSLTGHIRSRGARRRSERWAIGIIRSTRTRRLNVPEHCPLHALAFHQDTTGKLLTPRIAAVELLNLIRPIVAISVFIVLAAHAMHEHAEARTRIREGDEGFLERFVLEVRRYYPFFPAVVARVLEDFEWRGYRFPAGCRVMLDVYGTNHDDRTWHDPEAFEPDRFRSWDRSAYNFIAQGGGDHYLDHRCAGEWITIEIMKTASRFLAKEIEYEIPQQDLRIDFHRLPALPIDRFVMSNVRHHATTAGFQPHDGDSGRTGSHPHDGDSRKAGS
jgi:fatty-acid peroxygenase